MIDLWRQRCPKGHSSVRTYSENYRCNACEETYRGEPYDAAENEFPIDEDPRPKNIHSDILAELVQKCQGPMTDTRLARQMTVGSPRQVGRILAELEGEGLVERLGSGGNKGHNWRPTEAGLKRAIDAEREAVLKAGPQRARVGQ